MSSFTFVGLIEYQLIIEKIGYVVGELCEKILFKNLSLHHPTDVPNDHLMFRFSINMFNILKLDTRTFHFYKTFNTCLVYFNNLINVKLLNNYIESEQTKFSTLPEPRNHAALFESSMIRRRKNTKQY